MRLTRTHTHTSIQDISNVNTAIHHSVSIHLRSIHTDWHTTLDWAIPSNITGTTPSTKLDTSTWKIPKDIKLPYEQFDRPGGIDLLIGADLFYDILRSGRRTRPVNYPVLQETVIGWTLSGRTPVTPTTRNDPQHTFLLLNDNSLENNFNNLWEVEPMKQSIMTAEQHACEQHFIIHTTHQQHERFVVRLPTRVESKHLNLLASLQSEDYMQWKAGWNKNARFSIITSWRNLNNWIIRILWIPKEGRNHVMCYHIPIFNEMRATTSNWIACGGSAKTSNGIQ